MSDDQKGPDKGFGPRKPRATFGDVMLGIPAGRGGDQQDRPKGDRRREKPASAAAGETLRLRARPPRAAQAGAPQAPGPDGGRAPGERGHRDPGDRGAWRRRADRASDRERPAGRGPRDPDPHSDSHSDSDAARSAERALRGGPRGPVVRRDVRGAREAGGAAHRKVLARRREGHRARSSSSARTPRSSPSAAKSEAMIDLRELKDDEGILRFGVGDDDRGARRRGRRARASSSAAALTKGSASMAMLAEARASGMPVEGLVLAVNKGGFEVAVGDVRAFCPVSQIDVRFVEKPDQFVGERLKFRVTEVRERNVVLSAAARCSRRSRRRWPPRPRKTPRRGQGRSRARSPACATSASSSTSAASRA